MKGLKLRHLLPFLLECSVSNLLLGRQIFLFVDSGCSDLEELYDFCMNFELDRTNFFLVQKVRVQARQKNRKYILRHSNVRSLWKNELL